MEYNYDELTTAMDLLYVCARMIEAGRWTVENAKCTMHVDFYYDIATEALWSCCEDVYMDCNEEACITHYYFSDPCMMEYYRLCREYSRRRGLKLKDNPYMNNAKQYVREQLNGDWNSCYILHTKVNHRCASGIHFMYDENFTGEVALLSRLLNVFSFYQEGVEKLKAELAMPTALTVIYPTVIPFPLSYEKYDLEAAA